MKMPDVMVFDVASRGRSCEADRACRASVAGHMKRARAASHFMSHCIFFFPSTLVYLGLGRHFAILALSSSNSIAPGHSWAPLQPSMPTLNPPGEQLRPSYLRFPARTNDARGTNSVAPTRAGRSWWRPSAATQPASGRYLN